MTRLRLPLLAALCGLAVAAAPPVSSARGEEGRWSRLDAVARETIAEGSVPGVVLLVGNRGRVVYRKAFGNRAVRPEPAPMTTDTLFDLASLTKPVATAGSIMALVEEGRLRLRDPVSRFWPEFGSHGKERVTVRQLLTHTSGLPAWADYYARFAEKERPGVQPLTERVLSAIAETPLSAPSDTKFIYSDLGFITLGELVRRISGEPLDLYARRRLFRPLGMRRTTFKPDAEACRRAAPTTMRAGLFLQGEVHDGNAAVCGGVAGHAGLFSTADDLARFARMMLSSDALAPERYPLSPYTVREMTVPHTPAGLPLRGLGWDINSSYSHVRGDLLPVGSFGHTGFTGTYIWIDPGSETYIIGLSNRVHPDGKGNPLRMWARVANVVAGIVRPASLPRRALP